MVKKDSTRTRWVLLLTIGAVLAWGLAARPGQAADPQTQDQGKIPLQIGPAPSTEPEDETLSEDEQKAAHAAFKNFRGTLDVVNDNIAETFGGPPFRKVEYQGLRTAKVTPNKAWMDNKRIHYRNAMMLYSMWRNANQFRPVTLMIADDKGGDYITIKDTPQGIEYRARQFTDTEHQAAPKKPQ